MFFVGFNWITLLYEVNTFKMKNVLTKDTTIRIGDIVEKSSMGKVIECNVNMNVSVSNNKKTIAYRRLQNFFTLLIIFTFVIVYLQLKRDVRVLEAQVIFLCFI